MILETLDVRKNDVLIYSQNKFDFKNNFKIIFKNEIIKRPKTIDYFEVCEFIKDPSPKNLLAYRLLTNVNKLDAYSTKYGYFINIDNGMELIYFDPVFAIKDVRHLKFDLDPEEFRFKIQQVGLTSKVNDEGETEYNEVFSINMRAQEAQNQNDKIFADAIYAFDEQFIDEEDLQYLNNNIDNELLDDYKSSEINNLQNISEEKQKVNKELAKAQFEEDVNSLSERENKIGALKKALGIEKEKSQPEKTNNAFSEFLKQHRNENNTVKEEINDVNLLELFKSTSKPKQDIDDGKDAFLLKFNKK